VWRNGFNRPFSYIDEALSKVGLGHTHNNETKHLSELDAFAKKIKNEKQMDGIMKVVFKKKRTIKIHKMFQHPLILVHCISQVNSKNYDNATVIQNKSPKISEIKNYNNKHK